MGVYVLVAPEPDRQQPHADDEVYVVLDGHGTLEVEGERWTCARPATRFVAAGAEHRFVGIRGAERARDLRKAQSMTGPPLRTRARTARRLLARSELPLRRSDLPARQPAPSRAARVRAHQAAAAGSLRNDARSQLHLRTPEPRDQGARPVDDLHHRARVTAAPASWRTRISRGPTGALFAHQPKTTTACARSSASSRSRRHPVACRAGDTGSIHEGGELGYALSHAFGAAFDNPDLAGRVRGRRRRGRDRTARDELALEQVPEPATDGAVLPILHLNGYKIANPTVLARIPEHELRALRRIRLAAVVRQSELDEPPADAHHRFAAALDEALERSTRSSDARAGHARERPRWPMIVLRTPKGWTGPREVDGKQVEGTWRSHQVPVPAHAKMPSHRQCSKRGCGATGRRSSSTSTAGSCPSCERSRRSASGA